MNEKQQKSEKLMSLTGKGQLACDIALCLAHGRVEAAVARMRVSYPSMVVVGDEERQRPQRSRSEPALEEAHQEQPDKKPWE